MQTESTDAERKQYEKFQKWWFAVGAKLTPQNMETDPNFIFRACYNAWVDAQLEGE